MYYVVPIMNDFIGLHIGLSSTLQRPRRWTPSGAVVFHILRLDAHTLIYRSLSLVRHPSAAATLPRPNPRGPGRVMLQPCRCLSLLQAQQDKGAEPARKGAALALQGLPVRPAAGAHWQHSLREA